jgi:probable F420-dependent oxidoreductase
MAGRRMKFGFIAHPYDMFGSPSELARVVKRADQLGYDYVSFPDHVALSADIVGELGSSGRLDFPTVAAYLAPQTRQIQFASGVYILPLCNPFRLARQLVAADQVSGGRIIFGIGVGWEEQEFATLGVPFAERGAIANDYIAAIKALWRSEPASYSGRYVNFENVVFQPKPLRGDIPVMTGGAPGKRVFERIAKLCDGWMPWKVERDELPGVLEQLRAVMAENGRRLEDLDISWRITVGQNPIIARTQLHAAKVGEKKAKLDKPIADEIRELEALGISRVIVHFPGNSPDTLIEDLERFASEHIGPDRQAF